MESLKRTSDARQKHQHERPFLHYLFWLRTGSIPLLSWSLRAVRQPSLPALHHVPVTSPVGSSQLLICCLELASSGLASVKPLNDKIQVLSSLGPRFSTWTNGLFCLRHGHDCWLSYSDVHAHTGTLTHTFRCREKHAWTHTHMQTNTNTGAQIVSIAPTTSSKWNTEDVWLVCSLTPAVAYLNNSWSV